MRKSLLEMLLDRDGFVIERRNGVYFANCFSNKCIKSRMAGELGYATLQIDRRQMGGTGRCSKCDTVITALDYLMISPRDIIGEHDALRLIGISWGKQYAYIRRTKPIYRFVAADEPCELPVLPPIPAVTQIQAPAAEAGPPHTRN